MKRRILCFVLTMAMVLSMLVIVPAVTTSAASNTFNASDAEPLISTTADWTAFQSAVAGGNTFVGKTVKLGADIYVGKSFTGIGACTSKPFSGSFDGQGHTIDYSGYLDSGGDANRGLFNYVQIPGTDSNFNNNNIYIKNLHVTGSLVFGGSYIGGVVSALDSGTSGYGGTLIMENVWCSLNMRVRSSGANKVGGIVGYMRQGSGLKPIGLTFESCVWDGCIQFDVKTSQCGGFIGSTHNNNKDVKLTFKNSVNAGNIFINTASSDDVGMFIGYAVGNQGSNTVTVVGENLISVGQMIFGGSVGSNWFSVMGGYGSGTYTTMTANNVYYYKFTRPGKELPLTDGAGTSGGSNRTGYATKTDMLALTTSSFTQPAKWNKTANYYPCPQGIIDTFGEIPPSLYNLDISNVSTAAALQAVAQNVRDGITYEGQTINITADIDLTGLYWPTIGARNDNDCLRPFKGTIEGNNHVIKLASVAGLQSEGALVGYSQGATIRNLYLTGTLDLAGVDVQVGFFGSVLGCVGSGNTTISNVYSDVKIYLHAHWFQYSGGFVGGMENNVTAGISCTDCVYAGRIYANAAIQESGGFFGYTGNNSSTSYTKTVSLTRCVYTGYFEVNTTKGYISDNGPFVGYLRHNSSNNGYLNVTMTDCIMAGKMTFSSSASDLVVGDNKVGAMVGWAGKYSANATYSTANNYYVSFKLPDGNAAPAKCGEGTINATAKTASEMGGLTSSNFSGGSTYWSFSSGYIPCPAAIVNAFGWTSSFEVPAVTIATKDAFLAFRDAVNSGKSYSGEVLKLTADIDLTGESWREIGRAASTSSAGSNVFKGTFNGDGHTISNMTTVLEPTTGYVDMQGGLFGNLGDGAVVKNFTLTGSMTISNYYDGSGSSAFFGSVANVVSGTVLIQNVYSSVNITTSNHANPTSGKWGGGVTYAAGLVGAALHSSTTTLTIDGCEYAGTINCGNTANGTAGIMSHTGNGGTKIINITNTVFSGRVTLNDNGGNYRYSDCGGIFGRLATGTLNISNTHSGGDHYYFNRSRAWSATEISAGQIIGQVASGATANIAESVSYSPIVLYTEVSGGSPVESSKFVLGEIGYDGNTSTYTVDTPAHTDGFGSGAEARNVNDAYKGIRFTGTIFNTSACTGGGTQSANFGVFLMTKDIYDLFRGNLTYANLNAAATALDNVVKVMGLKYRDNGESYTVCAVVYNLNTTARKATELVVVPFLGTRLGDATVATYNSVFN